MAIPVALQLYSVREQCAEDFEATIRAVAAMGYRHVEPAGFPGTTPEAAAKLFAELDMKAPSLHGQLPVGEVAAAAIETAQMLGASCIVAGGGPGDFTTADGIKAVADRFNAAAAVAAEHGLTVGYHNHWWEFDQDIDGRCAYDVFVEQLSADVVSEVDTYWVTCGGKDAAETITALGDRAKLLHIKDGPGEQGPPQVAVGQGIMKWTPIFAAASAATCAIVELDACATCMMTAVKESYDYLTGAGLAE